MGGGRTKEVEKGEENVRLGNGRDGGILVAKEERSHIGQPRLKKWR